MSLKSPKADFNSKKLAWHEAVLTSSGLSTCAKALAGLLMHRFNFGCGGIAYAAIETYARELDVTEKSVRTAMKSLKAGGWIVVHRGRRGWNGTNQIEPNFSNRKLPSIGREVRQDAVKNDPDRLARGLPGGLPGSGGLGEEAAHDGLRINGQNPAKLSENLGQDKAGSPPVPNSTAFNAPQFPTGSVLRDAVKNDSRCGKKRPGDAVKNDTQFLYESLSSPLGKNDDDELKFKPSMSRQRSLDECADILSVRDFDPKAEAPALSADDWLSARHIAYEAQAGTYNSCSPKRLRTAALHIIANPQRYD